MATAKAYSRNKQLKLSKEIRMHFMPKRLFREKDLIEINRLAFLNVSVPFTRIMAFPFNVSFSFQCVCIHVVFVPYLCSFAPNVAILLIVC
jgi:hypothetical protein